MQAAMSGNVDMPTAISALAGKYMAFKTVIEEMIAYIKVHEPGTLVYECSINADQSECHFYERYADSHTTLLHMQNFKSHFAERFMDCVQPTRFVVYGNPSDELRAAWPAGIQIFQPLVGLDERQ